MTKWKHDTAKTIKEDLPVKFHDFYRGEHCNFMPTKEETVRSPEEIEQYILTGWTPDKPFITKSDQILTFGSCFADSVQNYLRTKGYGIPDVHQCNITKYGAGMANTFTIRQQLEWAYGEGQFAAADQWSYDPAAPPLHRLREDQEATRSLLDNTDVFIITIGLSEVWCDKLNGYVFWKAVPGTTFDPDRHSFRVSTVQENQDNLRRIVRLLRKHRPDAAIVFTLSPVSLLATFRPISCVTANCVSKSILRVAIDNVMNDTHDDKLFYWPSYEIVTGSSEHGFKTDHRHPKAETVAKIMDLFAKFYLADDV